MLSRASHSVRGLALCLLCVGYGDLRRIGQEIVAQAPAMLDKVPTTEHQTFSLAGLPDLDILAKSQLDEAAGQRIYPGDPPGSNTSEAPHLKRGLMRRLQNLDRHQA